MSIYGTPITASKKNTYFPGENISITDNKISTKAFPCNPNLLDNWYFGNPVNQRGASFVENDYGVDRWKGTYGVDANGTMGFNPSGFAIQGLEDSVKNILDGMMLTASILYENGTMIAGTAIYTKTGNAHNFINIGSIQFNNQADGNILLYAKSANQIKAVKLELGSQQTLAHQENGKWVLNEIPDYGEQLMRCQRYYRRVFKPNVDYAVPATAITEGVLHLDYALNPTMRTPPVLVGDTHGALRIVAYNVNDLSVAIAEPCDYIALVTNGTSVDRSTLKIVPNSGVSLVGKYCFTVDTFDISKTFGLSADL